MKYTKGDFCMQSAPVKKDVSIPTTPPVVRGYDSGSKRLETIIQGKKITASFATSPGNNILTLVKKILVDSHTNNMNTSA